MNPELLRDTSAVKMSTGDTVTRQMRPMLEADQALSFYQRYILLPVREKDVIRQFYGFTGGALVSPNDWELFAAILISARRAEGRYGHDLSAAEVKSAKTPGSFEYQYHLNTGLAKLEGDLRIDHLFISYSADYETVSVRVVIADALRGYFESWRPHLLANYASRTQSVNEGKQRFRRSIPYGVVHSQGRLILSIEHGELVSVDPAPLEEIFPNRQRAG